LFLNPYKEYLKQTIVYKYYENIFKLCVWGRGGGGILILVGKSFSTPLPRFLPSYVAYWWYVPTYYIVIDERRTTFQFSTRIDVVVKSPRGIFLFKFCRNVKTLFELGITIFDLRSLSGKTFSPSIQKIPRVLAFCAATSNQFVKFQTIYYVFMVRNSKLQNGGTGQCEI